MFIHGRLQYVEDSAFDQRYMSAHGKCLMGGRGVNYPVEVQQIR